MIGVGLIGASPDRGWALSAHLPAIRAVPDLELVAVATAHETTAARAAAVYGAPVGYGSADELLADPLVDLVVVSVRVPHHRRLVGAAIETGKAVLCEWPLGNGLAEAVELRDAAKAAGIRHFIGLQGRPAPPIAYVRDLIAEGFVGEVLSSSVVASGFGWGEAIDPPQTYLFDPANGATLLSIAGGHLLDAVRSCLGELHDVRATMVQRRHEVAVLDPESLRRYRTFAADLVTGGPTRSDAVVPLRMHPTTVPDQLAMFGLLPGGAPLSLHLRGGLSRLTNLLWEINGTEGDLVVENRHGSIQTQPLTIRGARGREPVGELAVPERYRLPALDELSVPAVNVGYLYAQVAADLADGGTRCADFDVAVGLHALLEDVTAASGR